jgi:hypothetical protein
MYVLYIDVNTRFKFDAFDGYKSLLDAKHIEQFIVRWVTNLNINVEHCLTFDVN